MKPLPANVPMNHRVLPMRALLLTLALALGVAYWLVPEPDELVERMLKDQQYKRLQSSLSQVMEHIDPTTLRKLPRDELSLLTTLVRLTPRERLNLIFSKGGAPRYNEFVHGLIIGDIRYVDVIKPADAWKMIEPHRARMSGAQFLSICTTLAHNALAISQPALAADILGRASDLPESTAQTAQELAAVFRWAGKPLQGAKHLRAWLSRRGGELREEHFAFLSETVAAMAAEGGDSALACEIAIDELKHRSTNGTIPEAVLERATNYALQCSRTDLVVAWVTQFVEWMPEAKWSLPEVKKRAATSPEKMKPYLKWAAQCAQIADWNSKFDTAFEQHLRLSVTGDVRSLERCLALSDFLGRDEEAVEALLLIGDVKGKPELKVTLAAMLASLGRDEEAQVFYQQWLQTHPDDRDVAYALACLLEDEGDEDGTLAAFEQLLKRHPGDVPSVKKLAENYIRVGRQHDALGLYRKLSSKDHDHYTLENYTMIAESLDEHEVLLDAQVLVARREGTAEAWLNIVETAGYLKDKAPALNALLEGLKQQPNSASLRVAIAQLHSEAENAEAAIAILMHPSTRRHLPSIESLLQLSSDAPNPAAVLEFVGADVEKRFELPLRSKLDLAVLCYLSGASDRGEHIFNSLPHTQDTLIACSEARYTIGHYEEAAELMNEFLKGNPRASSENWVFLGDIYDAMGRADDAKRAYNQSLTLLTADLPASKTTSSLTWPPPTPPRTP